MKRALIIIAIVLLIAAVVGVVLLGGLMMNNFAETGSVFGSGFDFSGGFWENIIGDEVLGGIVQNSSENTTSTEANNDIVVGENVFGFESLMDGTYAVYIDTFASEDGILRFPESYRGKAVTKILSSPSSKKKDKFKIKEIVIPDSVVTIRNIRC